MRKLIAGLAALALGGITVAHAQEMPSDSLMDQLQQEQTHQQTDAAPVADDAAPIVLAQRAQRSARSGGRSAGRAARGGGRSAGRGAGPRRSAGGRSMSRGSASRARAAPRRAGRSRAAQGRAAQRRAAPGRSARSRAAASRQAGRRAGTRTGEARRGRAAQRARAERRQARGGRTAEQRRAAQERRAARGDRQARTERQERTGRPDRPRERAGRDGRDTDTRRDGRRAAIDRDARDGRDARRPDGERRKAARAAREAKRVDLRGDRDRRDRVRKAFRDKYDKRHRRDVRRYRGVGFAVAVGAFLPAYWYYEPVPYEVVEVVPEYDGYMYAYVDDQYVIAHPETREVVGVLPAPEGPPPAAEVADAEVCKAAGLDLDEEQRVHILRSITIADEVDVSGIKIGWAVPRNIELQPFPEPVVERIGELEACRYFIADDQIAIVDPDQEEVVLLIEQES